MKRIFFALLTVLVSCTPRITMVSKNTAPQPVEGYLLALPQTVLQIRVDYIKTHFYKGPYAEYAEKYLGLKNVRTDDSEEISIKDIHISSRQQADTSTYYYIQRDLCFPNDVIQKLSQKGMIYDPITADYSPFTAINQPQLQTGNQMFSDMSVTNFYNEKTDTLYKIILRDSIFVKLPVLKNHLQIKSTDEVAKDVADLIIRMRSRRMEILAPDDEEPLNEKGIDVLLNNLDLLEGRYIRLFTGTERTEHLSQLFIVVPDISQNEIALRLSDTLYNEPIKLRFTKLPETPFASPDLGKLKKSVQCRIPAKTRLEVFADNKKSESYLYISQLGNKIAFPVKLLRDIK